MERLEGIQKEVFEQVKELMRVNALPKDVLYCSKRLIRSGGVDLSEFNRGDYIISKAILAAAFKQIADDLIPLSKDGKEIYNNLLHF